MLLQKLGFLLLIQYIVADRPWWENSTVYQIYPRSFQDTNGDGIGDLKGIESRLQHLSKFKGGSIWLSPIYQSPMVDFGYDISDFQAIDPIFGTIEDLQSLIISAHNVGVRVVLDFIPNHSSDQHEWFLKSLKREDPYTDYYVWVDPKGYDEEGNPIPPSNWISRFRGSMWTFREERQQFYLHQYLVQQPDLNYRNPQLKENMFDIIKFWMDLGVDGFRFDAVTKLVEDDRWLDEPSADDPNVTDPGDWLYYDHIYTNDLPETREILKEFYTLVKEYNLQTRNEERVVMLEAWLDINSTMEYYKCGDFPFNFGFVNMDQAPNAEQTASLISEWLSHIPDGKITNWVLGNHDRKRIGTRLGGLQYIDVFNTISLTLPGISVTYYGEEIGMVDEYISYEDTQDPWGCNCGPEHYQDCSRDPSRTPMQWSNSTNAGFSSANSTWLPVNPNFHEINVENESLQDFGYWFNYQKLLELRQTKEVLKRGILEYLFHQDNALFIVRGGLSYSEGIRNVISLINFNNDELIFNLHDIFTKNAKMEYLNFDPDDNFDFVKILLSTTQHHDINGLYDAYEFLLGPYEAVVFEFCVFWPNDDQC